MVVKIFGAGNAFKDFMSIKSDNIEVVVCYSSDLNLTNKYKVRVVSDYNEFLQVHSDIIVLALRDVSYARNKLIDSGVDPNTIISFYNSGDVDLLSKIQNDTKKLNNLLKFKLDLPCISNMWMNSSFNNHFDTFDWVRNKVFELYANQIHNNNISGACAELGVYRGDQASIINKLFPLKKLYLFDTFEGFSKDDINFETLDYSFSSQSEFSDTSIELVKSKLYNLSNVIFKKGFFPDSTIDMDDEFCFVSIDVDLFAPTLAGLIYFYPRLVKGGVLIVHDYNNSRFNGVRKAVDQYVNDNKLIFVQIPDNSGSVLLLK